MYELGKISREELSTTNNILIQLVENVIKISTQDFGIVRLGGRRTAEQQNQLYRQNCSKCDGYVNKSYHQSGLAVDLVPYVNGAYTWSVKEAFNKIHTAVMSIWNSMNVSGYKLRWGGNWKYYDPAHYELVTD